MANQAAGLKSSRSVGPWAWARPGIVASLLVAALAWPAPATVGGTPPSREYQVKAVFLFNFTQFVEWPAEAFADPTAPLVIGVLGEDPFGAFLDETVRGERANGRPLLVERFRRVQEIGNCQVLFISRSESDRLGEILASLAGKPILTVSDIEGFAPRGGVIRLVTVGGKIRLRINLDSARVAKLTISSKLLRPSEIVASGKD
jgi:YfiR/HmsC-like